jgi:integrase
MARATKWTDEKIKSQRLAADQTLRRVRVEPGLYLTLRQLADGKESRHWQYRVQINGARRWLSLGGYPAISLADAKEAMLRHHRAEVEAKHGKADHPVLVERHKRKASLAQPDIADVFDQWLAAKRLGSPRKRGEPVRERTVEILTGVFDADIGARIGSTKIAHISRSALESCIEAAQRRGSPGAAAHVYRTLRGLINFAIKKGLVTGDPMMGVENPRPYRPAEKVNAATDTEIVELLTALRASPRVWPSTRLAVEFQLLTGARPGEVRLAQWSEVDTRRATWTIPAERFKTDREFKVHLSPQALAVLQQARSIPRDAEKAKSKDTVDLIFPGASSGPLEKMSISHTLTRLAVKAGRRLRPHDLRRTFRTMLSRIGVAPHVAELCLGHINKDVLQRVYDGHDYTAEKIAAWDKAGAHIDALMSGGAQVVPLNRAA